MAELKRFTTIEGLPSYGLPIGIILMHDSNIWIDNSTIPGWCVCSNLIDKFPIGGTVSTVTNIGGTNFATIAVNEIPTHNHSLYHTHIDISIVYPSESHFHNYATAIPLTSIYYYGYNASGQNYYWVDIQSRETGSDFTAHTHTFALRIPEYVTNPNWAANASTAPINYERAPAYSKVIFIRRYA